MDELKKLIEEAHNPALTERVGNVCKVYSDGEITSEKSGPMVYGFRILHGVKKPLWNKSLIDMPIKLREGITYAIVEYEDAKRIRDLMKVIFEEAIKARLNLDWDGDLL